MDSLYHRVYQKEILFFLALSLFCRFKKDRQSLSLGRAHGSSHPSALRAFS
jgi:hypothetical protein